MELTEQLARDTLITACEGGINYWARLETYQPQKTQARVIIDDDQAELEIAAPMLARGFKDIASGKVRVGQRLRETIAASFAMGECASGFDTDAADAVVQAGAFGAVVYG